MARQLVEADESGLMNDSLAGRAVHLTCYSGVMLAAAVVVVVVVVVESD